MHEYGSAWADADRAHRGGGAVLLVVGVEDEQHVERVGERGVGVVARLGDLPHHRQEVRGEAERVVGVDERHARRGSGGTAAASVGILAMSRTICL